MTKPLILIFMLIALPFIYKLYGFVHHTPHTEMVSMKHLAIIMDGNRRWAKKHNQDANFGHRQGGETAKRVVEYCLKRGIEMVSLYMWSLENFQRSPEEVQEFFKMMADELEKELPGLIKNGIKIRFIGDRKCFPQSIAPTIEHLEKSTAQGKNLQLNMLFCYGGKQEILSAVNTIIKDVKEGKLDDVNSEEIFKKYLWTEDIPDPDLIIRTGGVKRLSNFLTYQTAYSELYFIDRFWPDITSQDLDAALREYAQSKRRFGK